MIYLDRLRIYQQKWQTVQLSGPPLLRFFENPNNQLTEFIIILVIYLLVAKAKENRYILSIWIS